jgi:hypothetical protein
MKSIDYIRLSSYTENARKTDLNTNSPVVASAQNRVCLSRKNSDGNDGAFIFGTEKTGVVMEKKCSMCGEVKPFHEFSPGQRMASGLRSSCRACNCKRQKELRSKNRAHVNQLARETYTRNRSSHPDRNRSWREKNKEGRAEYSQSYFSNNPEKRAAHIAVWTNIKKLNRPSECSRCHKSGVKVEGHHPDYSRPLEVEWLCRACHALIHRGSPRGKSEKAV